MPTRAASASDLGDDHVAPNPAFGEKARHRRLVMAMLAQSAPVEIDAPARLFQGLHVHQERPTLAGKFHHRGFARGGADERRRRRQRARAQHRDLDVPEPAAMSEFLACPGPGQDRLRLLQPRPSLGGIDAVAPIFVDVVRRAVPEADHQPALAEIVDQRELFGQADRVMERGLRHREADQGTVRGNGNRGGEAHRIDIGANAVEMVLGEPDRIEAEGVGEPCLRQSLLDHRAVLRRIAALGKQKVADPHASGAAPTYRN